MRCMGRLRRFYKAPYNRNRVWLNN
jgi:hypothetical protein